MPLTVRRTALAVAIFSAAFGSPAGCAGNVGAPENAPVPSAARNADDTFLVNGASASATLLRFANTRAPAVEVRVNAPAATALSLLAAAYDDVGLPHTAFDTVSRTIGALNVRVGMRIGDAPLARYISCGSGSLAEGVLSEYRVRLTLLSRVTADGGGSIVSTQLFATGERPAASTGVLRCPSSGRLEHAVGDALRKVLAATAPR